MLLDSKSEINIVSNSVNVNVANLPDGIYFIKVSDNEGTILKKNLIKFR